MGRQSIRRGGVPFVRHTYQLVITLLLMQAASHLDWGRFYGHTAV